MPTNTPNLGLIKPLVTENYTVEVANDNADILDEAFNDLDLEKVDTPTVDKVTPVDADVVVLLDSADTFKPKKWSIANVKAFLQEKLVSTTNIKSINGTSILGSGNVDLLPKNNPVVTGLIDNQGGQIKFPATQVPSADVNTLDDYEEGTWTPLVTATLGTITTVGAVSGTYTKIGRLVYATFNVLISNNGTGSISIKIAGLPFTLLVRGFGSGVESDVLGFNVLINGIESTNYVLVTKVDGTYPGGPNYRLIGSFTYITS